MTIGFGLKNIPVKGNPACCPSLPFSTKILTLRQPEVGDNQEFDRTCPSPPILH